MVSLPKANKDSVPKLVNWANGKNCRFSVNLPQDNTGNKRSVFTHIFSGAGKSIQISRAAPTGSRTTVLELLIQILLTYLIQ
jgi:hypothetical protein